MRSPALLSERANSRSLPTAIRAEESYRGLYATREHFDDIAVSISRVVEMMLRTSE